MTTFTKYDFIDEEKVYGPFTGVVNVIANFGNNMKAETVKTMWKITCVCAGVFFIRVLGGIFVNHKVN